MEKSIKPLFLSLFLSFFTVVNLYSSEITFLTHSIDNKYYIDKNNQMRGVPHTGRRAFNLELVREMMDSMNYPKSFKIVPFKRGLTYITQNKKPYALFNIGRRDSREKKMKWVGPLQIDNIYFYENIDNKTNIKSFNDAKKVKLICTIRGSFHEKLLKKNNFKNVIVNSDYKGCFNMLAIKRVDLTMISSNSINSILNELIFNSSLIKSTDVLFARTEGYMAFSNIIDDSVIMQWQKALDEIKKSGRYDEIAKKYLYPKEN